MQSVGSFMIFLTRYFLEDHLQRDLDVTTESVEAQATFAKVFIALSTYFHCLCFDARARATVFVILNYPTEDLPIILVRVMLKRRA
jgi:hypothetical protein